MLHFHQIMGRLIVCVRRGKRGREKTCERTHFHQIHYPSVSLVSLRQIQSTLKYCIPIYFSLYFFAPFSPPNPQSNLMTRDPVSVLRTKGIQSLVIVCIVILGQHLGCSAAPIWAPGKYGYWKRKTGTLQGTSMVLWYNCIRYDIIFIYLKK